MMHSDRIVKNLQDFAVAPNLLDYARTRAGFSWERAASAIAGLPDGAGINLGYETVDRHVATGRGGHAALRFIDKGFACRTLSFGDLAAMSNRFANVLTDLGVQAGDRIFALSGRNPALYAAAVGTWKKRGVFCAMFAAFGPEPIAARMTIGKARVLVTTAALYRRKVAPLRERLPALEHVLIIDHDGSAGLEGTEDLPRLLDRAEDTFSIEPTDPEEAALLPSVIMSPPGSRSICAAKTPTGVPPIPAG